LQCRVHQWESQKGCAIYTYVATTSTEYSQNTHDPKDPNKIKRKEKKVIDRKAADYGGLKPEIKKDLLIHLLIND
jgi:hypothetical protein